MLFLFCFVPNFCLVPVIVGATVINTAPTILSSAYGCVHMYVPACPLLVLRDELFWVIHPLAQSFYNKTTAASSKMAAPTGNTAGADQALLHTILLTETPRYSSVLTMWWTITLDLETRSSLGTVSKSNFRSVPHTLSFSMYFSSLLVFVGLFVGLCFVYAVVLRVSSPPNSLTTSANTHVWPTFLSQRWPTIREECILQYQVRMLHAHRSGVSILQHTYVYIRSIRTLVAVSCFFVRRRLLT